VTDATVTFETDFEGCGQCDQSTRIMYAQAALSAYGSDTVDASTGPGTTTGDDAGEDSGTPCVVSTTGMTGECILTTACAAMPGHVSTPGYCPGPDDIECCTGPEEDSGAADTGAATASDSGSSDGSATSSGDSAAPSGQDAGSGKPTAEDASTRPEAGPPSEGPAHDTPTTEGPEPDHAGKGCSSAPQGSPGPGLEWWAVGLVLAGIRRRTKRR
jgi:MYXO-CTERM domain-containing protein